MQQNVFLCGILGFEEQNSTAASRNCRLPLDTAWCVLDWSPRCNVEGETRSSTVQSASILPSASSSLPSFYLLQLLSLFLACVVFLPALLPLLFSSLWWLPLLARHSDDWQSSIWLHPEQGVTSFLLSSLCHAIKSRVLSLWLKALCKNRKQTNKMLKSIVEHKRIAHKQLIA